MSTSLDKLRQAMESASPSQGEKKSYNDDRYWKPELDKSGNGYAVVRFLPTPEEKICLGFHTGIMVSTRRMVY